MEGCAKEKTPREHLNTIKAFNALTVASENSHYREAPLPLFYSEGKPKYTRRQRMKALAGSLHPWGQTANQPSTWRPQAQGTTISCTGC